MTADRDLAEDRLHGGGFRHGCIGERAQIIFDCRKILHHIRIAHSEYNGAAGGVIEDRGEQRAGRIVHGNRIRQTSASSTHGLARRRNHIHRSDHVLRRFHRLDHGRFHATGRARIDIDHARIRHTG